MMLFLHSQVKTDLGAAKAPAENQPRRNEEHEGFSWSFFVFFVSSWFIFILYRGAATRPEGSYEEALIDPPARSAAARTAGPDRSSAGPWVILRRPAAPDRRSRSKTARRPPCRKPR